MIKMSTLYKHTQRLINNPIFYVERKVVRKLGRREIEKMNGYINVR